MTRTSTYVFGIQENADAPILDLSFQADSNDQVFDFIADYASFYRGDDFSLVALLTVFVEEYDATIHLAHQPDSDHTYHIYNAADQTMRLQDKDTREDLVTFPLLTWAARYGHGPEA